MRDWLWTLFIVLLVYFYAVLAASCSGEISYTTKHGIAVVECNKNQPTQDEIEQTTENVVAWFLPYFKEDRLKDAVWGTVVEFYSVEQIDGGVSWAYPNKTIKISTMADVPPVALLWHELGHIVLWHAPQEPLANKDHHPWMCATGFEPAACDWPE